MALLLREGPLADKCREQGLPVSTLAMSFDLDLVSLARAFFYFQRQRPDLIILNDQRECRTIAPAAALAGIEVRVQRKGWPFLKGSWRDRLVYRRFVTHLIAVSRAVADVFRERSVLPEGRIAVIPNGLDLDRLRSGDGRAFRQRLNVPEEDWLIGSAGRLVTQKGFDLLVRAAGVLRQRGLSPWLAIAGEGGEREKLVREAEEHGVSDRLVLAGQVEDMPGFYAALDLFAFPSRMEGRSNALAEAMAAGLPIVATDIPGSDELITSERTGIMVPPENAEELAHAIERLIRDRDLAGRLGDAARAWASENLAWEKMLDDLEGLLERLLAEARERP